MFFRGMEGMEKTLLLYSGGLDTSVMVKWIQEKYGTDVVCFLADLGQPKEEIEAAKEKTLALGALKCIVPDLNDEFADRFISKSIKANGLYEGEYPLSTALGRYLIVEKAVQIAKQEGCTAIAHGGTGKGNVQVRFELSIKALAPKMKIFAPVREFELTRDVEKAYAKEKEIPIPEEAKKYSIDENMWGKSTEEGPINDASKEPPKDIFTLSCFPEDSPDKPVYVKIGFEKGVPISLNGKKMPLKNLVETLNKVAGSQGVGIIDCIEDRTVGVKSHEVYECPAAVCLIKAHKDLEKLVLTKELIHFKKIVDNEWAKLVYTGLWFDPLVESLNAFIEKANERVEGWVKLKLYKGGVQVAGRDSKYSLYNPEFNESVKQKHAIGFIELYGLQQKVWSMVGGERDDAMAEKVKVEQLC